MSRHTTCRLTVTWRRHVTLTRHRWVKRVHLDHIVVSCFHPSSTTPIHHICSFFCPFCMQKFSVDSITSSRFLPRYIGKRQTANVSIAWSPLSLQLCNIVRTEAGWDPQHVYEKPRSRHRIRCAMSCSAYDFVVSRGRIGASCLSLMARSRPQI